MKTTALWFAALCFAGGVQGEAIPPKPVDGKIKWVYRYAEGKEQARKTGKPLFVVFRCER